jgi:adenine-specific DNA-methyltransferase
MRDRLEIIKRLLSDDGSLWITIDDNEAHYLKVICDEIFGRNNFVSSFAWEKDQGRRGDTDISSAHDHILLYVLNRDIWRKTRNLLPRTSDQESRYKNPDNDPRGRWLQGDNGTAKSGSESARFPITLPSGRVVTPPPGNFWRFSKENFEQARAEGRVHFGAKGDSMPVIKRYLTDVQQGVVPRTFWTAEEAGTNQSAKRDHLRKLLSEIEPFATPKPEELLRLILQISTDPNDLVLDSFAGSGTTGAVAHKMNRRWIMVELEETCWTHTIPRLRKVIDGADPGGITKAVDWKGGGGFRYYELAPSLLEKDKWGREVISKRYNAAMLTQALCKLEGFSYAPSPDVYWQQGRSSETDFLYVTTQTLDQKALVSLSEEVGEGRTLLVLCSAFRGRPEQWPNLTVRKIPNHIRTRCEWGRDDYSLNVANLPMAEKAPAPEPVAHAEPPRRNGRGAKNGVRPCGSDPRAQRASEHGVRPAGSDPAPDLFDDGDAQ